MNKFFNWLFSIKEDTKEDEEKRIAEINSTLNKLHEIDNDIRKKKREIEAIDKYLKATK